MENVKFVNVQNQGNEIFVDEFQLPYAHLTQFCVVYVIQFAVQFLEFHE